MVPSVVLSAATVEVIGGSSKITWMFEVVLIWSRPSWKVTSWPKNTVCPVVAGLSTCSGMKLRIFFAPSFVNTESVAERYSPSVKPILDFANASSRPIVAAER